MKVKKNIVEIENRLEQISLEKEELLKEALKIEGEHLKSYGIRPAGRHLLTIGEDLIQDPYAAIVELVKNCYDADSPDAKIVFKKRAEEGYLEIRIEDHGHGMSTDDVVNKWLVPSTNYKLETRISPLGRTMQGRKGIGRYAASILGDDLKLETTDENGIETTLQIQWQKLAQYEYLDQIRIPVSTQKTDRKAGTILVIHSSLTENTYWNKRTFQKLRFELKN